MVQEKSNKNSRMKPKKKFKEKSEELLNYEKKYKEYLTSYKTIKTSLKSISKNNSSLIKINEAVINVNKIIIQTYQFLKLYCLSKFEQKKKFPLIDDKLVYTIMKVLCVKDPRGHKPNKETIMLKRELDLFYRDEFQNLLNNDNSNLCYTHLNTVLDYEAISMVTGFKNHISEHFVSFLNRYINVLVNKKEKLALIKDEKGFDKDLKKRLKRLFLKEIRQLKDNIIKNKNNCPKEYMEIKKKIRQITRPSLTNSLELKFSFIKNEEGFDNDLRMLLKGLLLKDELTKSLDQRLTDNPFLFLKPMIKMSMEIEKMGKKTFSCFPLRKNIIPKYIKLDTTTIIHLLLPDDLNKRYYLNNGNTKLLQDPIWGLIFKTNKKIFKQKKYTFNHQISTDGIGCSLLFIRNDLYDPLKVKKIKAMTKPFNFRNEKYVNELTDEEKDAFKDYEIVAEDPGKGDIIYATNGETIIDEKGRHKTKTFRYTQNQRRKEIKTKKYRKIREKDKKKSIGLKMNKENKSFLNGIKELKLNPLSEDLNKKYINYDKTIEALESELCKINSKSNIYSNVKEYIKLKNQINAAIQDYYQKEMFRKLKWYSFINKQRSESNMIERFKEIFGPPEKVIVCIGDYDNRNMKYQEPTKGKSMRKLFRNAGYNTFLVNEYNTSCRSFLEGKKTKKFRKRINPRPWKHNICKSHGLLRFKSVTLDEPSKHILVNRNFNGSMNIWKKAKCILNNEELPKYLCRKNK